MLIPNFDHGPQILLIIIRDKLTKESGFENVLQKQSFFVIW